MTVKTAGLDLIKSQPPRLVINASGLVPTSGWENGRIEPRIYIQSPADNIYDFDFVADAPSDIALMVISPITAKPFEWDNPPGTLKGVRIRSRTNHVEVFLC